MDDERLTLERPDGTIEGLAWAELEQITILTTDAGPFSEDIFWVFTNADRSRGCVVPSGVDGFSDLMERIQKLAGFDNEAVIAAMTSTSDASFVVWQRR